MDFGGREEQLSLKIKKYLSLLISDITRGGQIFYLPLMSFLVVRVDALGSLPFPLSWEILNISPCWHEACYVLSTGRHACTHAVRVLTLNIISNTRSKICLWLSSSWGTFPHTHTTSSPTLSSWLKVKELTQIWYVWNTRAYKLVQTYLKMGLNMWAIIGRNHNTNGTQKGCYVMMTHRWKICVAERTLWYKMMAHKKILNCFHVARLCRTMEFKCVTLESIENITWWY